MQLRSVDLNSTLQASMRAVDQLIFRHLPESHTVREIALLYRMMREYPSKPGKGLRPTLCLLACEAFGGRPADCLPTAAALQVFHNWILIHDDIEDDSDLRRGEPALHKKYSVPLALNAGDALHAKMWEILLDNRSVLGPSKTLAVFSEFQRILNETTEGQHMELSWILDNRWDLREDDYYLMVQKKASWYSFVAPFRMGTIIADADGRILDGAVRFGQDVGVAFQIRDDILNLAGDPAKYGKELAGDLWEGKRTLLLIHLLGECTPSERARILRILGKPRRDKTAAEIRQIQAFMQRYGSIEYARARSVEFGTRARKTLAKITADAVGKDAVRQLHDLIDFVIHRDW